METGKNNIFRPSDELRNLRLLDELEKNPNITQRELSHKFGIALGVTNACLKRMVRKGWIRIRGINHRDFGYYLTPRGILEKSRLTLHLVSGIIQHYSDLKRAMSARFLEMERRGIERVVFYGISDEMEVAYVTLQGANLKLVGIVEDDEKFEPRIIFGHELERVSRIRQLRPECVLITSLMGSSEKRERLKSLIGEEDIWISDICIP